MGDRLEPLIRERIDYEVHRRVFENYKKGKFWWEAGENNWAAVCGGSVAGALMYLDPELFEELKPRLMKTLDAFIKNFPDDGTCRVTAVTVLVTIQYLPIYIIDILREKPNCLKAKKLKISLAICNVAL